MVGLAVQPAAAAPAYAASNGIVQPAVGEAVRGAVAVSGVAHGADFAKWQLDLLPAGDATNAVFLAVGETAAPAASPLAQFDSTRFADGAHTLRLRVVRHDGNYDEYFTPIIIANRAPAPAPASNPPASNAGARLVTNRAAALGLPVRTAAGQPILYLTFDDGPTTTLTPQILEVLDRYDAKATFFVVGRHVQRAPAGLRLVAEAGHAIENHSMTHRWLTNVSQQLFSEELTLTEETVLSAVGDLLPADHRLRYYRPPYGAVDANTGAFADALGYKVVGWDLDPKDWRRPGAAAISSFVIQRAFPGAIVVLHDGGGANQQTAIAVETILEELGQQGYVFHALPSAASLSARQGVRANPVSPIRSDTD